MCRAKTHDNHTAVSIDGSIFESISQAKYFPLFHGTEEFESRERLVQQFCVIEIANCYFGNGTCKEA